MDSQSERAEIARKVFDGVTYRELDALDEKIVRYSLAKGEYGAPGNKSHDIVLAWLASKNSKRAASTSRWARHAAYAAYAAATMAAIGAHEQIKWLIMAAIRVINP